MQSFTDVIGKFSPPPQLGKLADGPNGINLFINNSIALLYTIAGLMVVIYFLWGAFDWITAGNDKDKLKGAQVTITRALMGLAFLSVTFVLLYVLGRVLGFQLVWATPTPVVMPKGAVTR